MPEEAHELINYLIKPEVAAKNTNYVSYANGNLAEPVHRQGDPRRPHDLS